MESKVILQKAASGKVEIMRPDQRDRYCFLLRLKADEVIAEAQRLGFNGMQMEGLKTIIEPRYKSKKALELARKSFEVAYGIASKKLQPIFRKLGLENRIEQSLHKKGLAADNIQINYHPTAALSWEEALSVEYKPNIRSYHIRKEIPAGSLTINRNSLGLLMIVKDPDMAIPFLATVMGHEATHSFLGLKGILSESIEEGLCDYIIVNELAKDFGWAKMRWVMGNMPEVTVYYYGLAKAFVEKHGLDSALEKLIKK